MKVTRALRVKRKQQRRADALPVPALLFVEPELITRRGWFALNLPLLVLQVLLAFWLWPSAVAGLNFFAAGCIAGMALSVITRGDYRI